MSTALTYYPANCQKLIVDEPTGSKFWSIAGNNLQFTWFEVPPHSIFEKHSHLAEQITHVLKGVLFFKSGSVIYKLSEGDSITVPSNVIHEVWTEDIPVIAVDA